MIWQAGRGVKLNQVYRGEMKLTCGIFATVRREVLVDLKPSLPRHCAIVHFIAAALAFEGAELLARRRVKNGVNRAHGATASHCGGKGGVESDFVAMCLCTK